MLSLVPHRVNLWFIAMLLLSSQAKAAVLVNSSGNASLVTNVVIDGTNYNATFHVGSFNDVFGSSATPDPMPLLTDQIVLGDLAAQQIAAQLNASLVARVADFSTEAPTGFFAVPISVSDTSVGFFGSGRFTSGFSSPLPWGGVLNALQPRSDTSFFDGDPVAYVQFSESASVPQPSSAIALFSLCLVLIPGKFLGRS